MVGKTANASASMQARAPTGFLSSLAPHLHRKKQTKSQFHLTQGFLALALLTF